MYWVVHSHLNILSNKSIECVGVVTPRGSQMIPQIERKPLDAYKNPGGVLMNVY